MAIGNYYPVSNTVVDADLLLGTKAGSNNTVNYTAQTVVDYLNTNSKISIGGQLSFQFVEVPNISKTISFLGGGGDNTPFSSINKLIVSVSDLGNSNVTVFLNYLNGSEILLAQQNEPNLFGHYKITGYTVTANPNFYTLDLQFIGGNGNIGKNMYYDLASFVLSSGGNVPTLNQVLTAGNTSLLDAYIGEEFGLWDNTNSGYMTIKTFDNSFIFEDSANNKMLSTEQGMLSIFKSNSIAANLIANSLTASRSFTLPDASGTIALTSDIPLVTTPTLDDVLTSGNVSLLDAKVGSLYLYDTVELDYGNLDLSDSEFRFFDVYGQAVGANRAGVTFFGTVGSGFYGSILLPSLTANRTYTLPNASGTIALTSDIPTGGSIPHATASGTDTYTATVTGVTSYADADAYLIRFTNGNTTGATLNINGLGAIPLYENNNGPLIGGDIWDNGEMLCVYNSSLNIFQCIGTSANSLFAYVTNADSVAITKGQPVYAFGGTGDRLTVKRAFNTSDAGSAKTIGVVLTSSIAVNQKGIIIIQGLLDGLSILPTATWSDGDTVYLGTTAGSITNVKQYAPNHLVYLGTVTTASNGSSGRWYVRVQNGYELDELHNVQAQTPSLKDTLWYDNTVSPAQWKTASISTILGYTPFNLPSLTSGSVLFSNGTTIAQDNANFFWDNTNKRLGVGTTFPSHKLTVEGDIKFGTGTGAVETIRSAAGGSMLSYDPIASYVSIAGTNLVIDPVNLVISTYNSIGIGTSGPLTALEVVGVITATGGNSTSWNAKQDPITLTTTGTSGAATLVGTTLNIPQYAGGSATPINVQLFTSSGVWTKPTGATIVEVYLVSGAGGGGSGRRGAAGTARYGGGGGASGAITICKMQASSLGSTENIWIGVGGNGGAAVTVNDTNGNGGVTGLPSFFGGTGSAATSKISTGPQNGSSAAGGTATANGSNSGASSWVFNVSSSYSRSTNNSNGFGSGNNQATFAALMNGGYGGGLDTLNGVNLGQNNRIIGGNSGQIISIVNGGAVNGGAGDAGSLITNNASNLFFAQAGAGGGSGNAAGTIAGGAGGAGGPGAGGGGGGASTNGANSGAGGRGGDGFCMVVTYF